MKKQLVKDWISFFATLNPYTKMFLVMLFDCPKNQMFLKTLRPMVSQTMTEPERIQSPLETAAFIAAAGGDNAWEESDSTHLPT